MSQGQYRSQRTPDYLKASAIVLSRGAWISTYNAAENIVVWALLGSAGELTTLPDSLAGSGDWGGNP